MKTENTPAIERVVKQQLARVAGGKPIEVECSQQVDSRGFIVEAEIGGRRVSRFRITEAEYQAPNWRELVETKLAEDLEQNQGG